MTAAAVAVVAAAGRRVIDNLREQGAYSPGTAAPLDLRRGVDRRVLGRLQRSGIVIANGPDRYHLDLNALDAFDARMRRVKVVALGVLSVGAVVGLLAALL